MKNLKRLAVAFALTLVLGVAAFAGETLTPPCAPPDPGITETPPCVGTQILPGDSGAPGPTSAGPATNARTEFLLADVAIGLLQSVMSLF